MAMGGLIGPRLLCPVPVAPTPSAGSPGDGRSVRAQRFFLFFFFSHHPDAITPSVIAPLLRSVARDGAAVFLNDGVFDGILDGTDIARRHREPPGRTPLGPLR